MTDLSVLIPARNEMFLRRTIEDILAHAEGDTEVIAVLDGRWTDPPIPDHERVTLIYHSDPIGQRAATNEAAHISRAKYIMKCDAHCAFDQGFDLKMMREMHDDWTLIPTMRNLHAFDWVCKNGHRRYQGPSGPCTECGEPTSMDIVWIAKTNPQSNSYCFDPTPHFQYFGDYSKRPEGKGDLTETMSIQGSCFMMTREKYWELNACDESFGFWGSQGIEVAVKTWLSGGRVMVNHKTWYAHLFRTQGSDFGFPYPLSGRQVDHAKKMARDLFFNNKWPQQVRPLSWLVERFWPVQGWTDADLANLKRLDPISNFSALITPSSSSNGMRGSEFMPALAQDLLGVDGGGGGSSHYILAGQNKDEMSGVAADTIVTNMIENKNITSAPTRDRLDKPSIHEPMNIDGLMVESGISIPLGVDRTSPQPATGILIEVNPGENLSGLIGSDIGDDKKFIHVGIISPRVIKSKAILYYTCNTHREDIEQSCRTQLLKARNGNILATVSRQPIDFGDWNIVIDRPRSPETMHRQILAGLEKLEADIVFLCESDVLYHPSHFDFTPRRRDVFYYDTNVWRVRYDDGLAVWTDDLQQVSGCCAYRELLLDFYTKRVAQIEREGFNGHYEPGVKQTIYPRMRGGKYGTENWKSAFPNICIRHDQNLTRSKWSPEEFRNPVYAKGWKEAGEVPGWGVTKGRFGEFLKEIN